MGRDLETGVRDGLGSGCKRCWWAGRGVEAEDAVLFSAVLQKCPLSASFGSKLISLREIIIREYIILVEMCAARGDAIFNKYPFCFTRLTLSNRHFLRNFRQALASLIFSHLNSTNPISKLCVPVPKKKHSKAALLASTVTSEELRGSRDMSCRLRGH